MFQIFLLDLHIICQNDFGISSKFQIFFIKEFQLVIYNIKLNLFPYEIFKIILSLKYEEFPKAERIYVEFYKSSNETISEFSSDF